MVAEYIELHTCGRSHSRVDGLIRYGGEIGGLGTHRDDEYISNKK